ARRRGGWWGTWRRAPGPPLDVREHPRPVRGRGGPRVLARRGTPGSSCSPPPPGRGRASWRAPGRSRSDAGLLLHLVGGDEVLELQVVVRAQVDAALVALADLGDIVLEASQTGDLDVLGDHRALAGDARLGA